MSSFYENRRVLITGGSSGIGKATAKLAAAAGAHVHILGRNGARLQAAIAEIRNAASGTAQRVGGNVLDVADRLAVTRAVPGILEALGGIDVLVNNAGICLAKTIADTDLETFERVMATNYLGSVWITRAFLPHLLGVPNGRIAFVDSLAGLFGVYGYGAYVPSKFAMTGFVEVLRQELLGSNVRVSIVFPPDVNTPMLIEEMKDRPLGTTAVAGTAGALEPEVVAAALLEAVEKGRYQRVVGFTSRISMWVARHLAWLVRMSIDRDLRRIARSALQGEVTPPVLTPATNTSRSGHGESQQA